MQAELHRGELAEQFRPISLPGALDTYLLQLRASGRSPHTVAQYRRHILALGAWLRAQGQPDDIAALTGHQLAEFMTSDAAIGSARGSRKRETSINALRTSLRCFFAHLHAAGHIPRNPARLLRIARAMAPPPHPIADGDLQLLLERAARDDTKAGRRDHALIVLLSGSGMRLGSAVGLNVEDIDLRAGEATLRSAKGGRTQRVLLTKEVCGAVAVQIGERKCGPVFTGRTGKRLSTRHVQRRFALLLKRTGVERRATVHSLRHRYATRLYQKTSDILLVKQALGHRNIASTMVYVDADTSRLRAAVGE